MKRKIKQTVALICFAMLSLVLVACGGGKNVTVTFNPGEGASVTPETISVAKGSLIEAPEATKQNYTVTGWYLEDTFDTKWDFDNNPVLANMTLYAKWDITKYVISFNSNGGSLVGNVETVKGGNIALPVNPTKAGYTFAGWYLDSNLSSPFLNYNLQSNLTLYAKWTEGETPTHTTYTVEFDANGGSNVGSLTVIEGHTATKPKNPTKGGYLFKEWQLEGVTFNFDTAITSDIRLVAVWEEIVVQGDTVVYEHNFSTDGVAGDFLSFNEAVDLEAKFVVDKYGVNEYQGVTYDLGYKINADGYIHFTTTESNLKLVIYAAMRDSIATSIKVNTTQFELTKQFNVFEMDLTTAGTYKIDRFDNKAKECGILFLAIYKEGSGQSDIVVTFDTKGGSQVANQTVLVGSVATKPAANPTKSGQVFVGWYSDSACTNLYDFDAPVLKNITLYAKWIDEGQVGGTYEVEFDSDGGTDVAIVPVTSGHTVAKPKNPTKPGYLFKAWLLNGVVFNFDTPITSDITLVAQWEEIVVEGGGGELVYEHNFSTDGVAGDFLAFNSNANLEFNFVVDKYGINEHQGVTYDLGFKINSEGFIQFTTKQDNLKLVIYAAMRDSVATSIKVNTTQLSLTQQFNVFEVDLVTAGTYKIDRFDNKAKECGILYIAVYTTSASQPSVTVTFNSNGGSAVDPITTVIGSAIDHPEEYPTKGEEDFVGWYTDQACTNLYDFDAPVLENITLYAKWAVLPTYTIIYEGTNYLVKEGRPFPEINYTIPAGKIFVRWEANGQPLDTTKPITSSFTLTLVLRDVETYTIEFETNGGSAVNQLSFKENQKVVLPADPTKPGHIFLGWYIDSALVTSFNKNNYLTTDIRLYAKWLDENNANFNVQSGAYYESIWATWEDPNPEDAVVSYSIANQNNWTLVDKELIRRDGKTGNGRVDIVGLKSGNYDIKIVASMKVELMVEDLYTEAHDRSGYAHFNYTEGIGAYKDDGTLKSDAIVVYVTESNKNSITIPGITQVGLGWILNNAQYSKEGSTTYGKYPSSETLSAFNQPIVFRLIGKVTVPEGATGYSSLVNGGTKGDNGNMVRMKDANNITIEGIGEDAEIYGWGIHFMAATAGRGRGFEVRNISFKDVPEDAIGMEGIQTGSTLTAPVERGWIHNNIFYAGYCANPAESDKAHGDGSLDTKRGQYFTISYNRFDNAHKTNLIGASDSNLTYHLTFHHNVWTNCASRIPLARQGNIHMYNNVFEVTDDNKNEVSYAQNTRANAYIFSEANFFYGVKKPSDVASGAIKSYNDVKYSTHNTDGATVVTDRTAQVKSGNKYEHFDTDSAVFYYDAVNKRSNVTHLTDAVTARAEVEVYAGTYRNWEQPDIDNHRITNQTPVTIEKSQDFPGGKINKGTTFLVFKILVDAEVTLVGSGSVPPVLVTIYGERILTGSGTAKIEAGTYVIESAISHGASKGQSQAKDATVGSFSIKVDDGAASQARIAAAEAAINKIPATIDYSEATYNKILDAKELYDLLKAEEKLLVPGSKITTALASYKTAGKSHIEGLINAIGTVNENSLQAITVARTAYDRALSDIKSSISNYSVLTAAELAFESYHVTSVINLINSLVDVNSVALNRADVTAALNEYNLANDAFNGLSPAQKLQITNSSKLSNGLTKLNQMIVPFEIIDIIDSIIVADITNAGSQELTYAYNTYQTLSAELKDLIDAPRVAKLNSAWAKYQEEASKVVEYVFYIAADKATPNSTEYFTSVGTKFEGGDISMTFGDIVLKRGIKLQSSTNIQFVTKAETSVIKVVFAKNPTMKLDGKDGVVTNSVLEMQIGKGTHNITKGASEGVIAYIIVTEGATLNS